MDRVSKLMVFLIVAITLPALLVAGKPAETQKCEINGDILSNPVVVEIGISAWALTYPDDPSQPASLLVKGSLLQVCTEKDVNGKCLNDLPPLPPEPLYAPIVVDEDGYPKYESCIDSNGDPCDVEIPIKGDDLAALLQNTEGYFEYYGHASALKKNGWLSFEFGPLLGFDEEEKPIPCVSPTYEDLPTPWGNPDLDPDKAHLCPYGLLIHEGLYVRQTDTLMFDYPTLHGVALIDYSLGELGVRVGNGPPEPEDQYDRGWITVQFLPGGDGGGGDETEPEKGDLLCHDTFDNDGDGRVDCDDPNCKKWCP